MKQEEEIFEQAMALSSGEAREGYLLGACGQNRELRRNVDQLLAAFNDAGALDFLNTGERLQEAQSVPADTQLHEAPGTVIGRYKLLQKIGEGGMGVVYMAEQEEPVRRRVALKIIKLGMDTGQVVARFEAERQALAMMDHPNIARVLDGGATDTGRPYFVMELVQGVPITEFCDQNQLPAQVRMRLFIQVCQAIQSAHQKGIIHRDIKPSNVLVTLHHSEPMPKVIDFGIAKATNQKLTEKTLFTNYATMIGTPAYMSPEQAEMTSMDVDTRTDVYSLGVLLYELLTGSTPFPEKRLRSLGYSEMQRVIVNEEPQRPSTRLSTMGNDLKTIVAKNRGGELAALSRLLRGDLDWVVMRCLEKDRRRRYDTPNELVADIERHLRNEPVFARPPTVRYRFQKMVRRNKLAVAAASAVTLTLVVGLGVSTWKTFEAQTERKRSRRLLYTADMNLAQQSLNLNNLGKAQRLMDRHRPQPGEEDLRGWEWRYLWQLTRGSALVTLTNRSARATAVSFSLDGTRLAVGWDGGRVELWDVLGRRWVRALTDREFRHRQGRVAFSPVQNLLVATAEPDIVALYDLDSGRESNLWKAPDPDRWDVRDLAFSPDGSKVVIYAGSVEKFGDAVWVADVSSSRIEGPYPTVCSLSALHGSARLSPDNRRLYLARSDFAKYRYRIQCLDLTTGQPLWETKPERDYGLTTMALSPDGLVLASGSGFEDPGIQVWDAATGNSIKRLDGHTGWVSKLEFTKDGRRLISASSDQTIRFWETGNWRETNAPLRGHADEVYAVAISATAGLVASASRDGDVMLWKDEEKSATNGYGRLRDVVRINEVLPLEHARVLLLPPGQRPELVNLKHESPPLLMPEMGFSTNFLGLFGTNILCQWDGSNQVLVHEWRGAGFIQQGAISLDSNTRPLEFAYNATRQLMAWTDRTSSTSVYLKGLTTPDRRIELKSDIPRLVLFRFSEDGNFLAATAEHNHSLRAWNVETRQILASINEPVRAVAFAAGGRVLVAAIERGRDHEIGFYNLDHPGQAPRRVPGKSFASSLAVSPDGGLVASATGTGEVRLFDPLKGEYINSVHGQNGAACVVFSPDGRRLISTSGGQEAVKVWDVVTRQELLTLVGIGSLLEAARWSTEGDVILAGPPWQAWWAPSWEEIAVAERKDKTEIKQP